MGLVKCSASLLAKAEGRATRSDSGESGSDMTINRIVSAGWSAAHNGSAEPSNLTMTSMERALGSIQNFDEGTQYDVLLSAKIHECTIVENNKRDTRLAIPDPSCLASKVLRGKGQCC